MEIKIKKITAQLVMSLRKKIGAPLMECKKALLKFNGDFLKSEKFLKSKINKKFLCTSFEKLYNGIIVIFINEKKKIGTILEIKCETDFISKNLEFIKFSNKLVKLITNKNSIKFTKNEFTKIKNKKIEKLRLNFINKTKEKILINRFLKLKTKYQFTNYIHDNKIGVIIEFKGENIKIAKEIAMHIAAMKPIALDINEIPSKIIKEEKSILLLKISKLNKPKKIIKKIIKNSINNFLKKNSLYNQIFIKDKTKTIKEILKIYNLIIYSYNIFILGEKINEK
ncbi:translation elongation factor Ts [Candidatus Zinderia endosymbiont of Aphrophora alni]|uniref:translation elongation factor Ts n=1 Tax=Candidatus Zinderia endosymbiont of Aphrophora alni TaxID=3077951 RepID=UPI0030D59B5D